MGCALVPPDRAVRLFESSSPKVLNLALCPALADGDIDGSVLSDIRRAAPLSLRTTTNCSSPLPSSVRGLHTATRPCGVVLHTALHSGSAPPEARARGPPESSRGDPSSAAPRLWSDDRTAEAGDHSRFDADQYASRSSRAAGGALKERRRWSREVGGVRLSNAGFLNVCTAAAASLQSMACEEALPHVSAATAFDAISMLPFLSELTLRGMSFPANVLRIAAVKPKRTIVSLTLIGPQVGSSALAVVPRATPCLTRLRLEEELISSDWDMVIQQLRDAGSLFDHLLEIEVTSPSARPDVWAHDHGATFALMCPRLRPLRPMPARDPVDGTILRTSEVLDPRPTRAPPRLSPTDAPVEQQPRPARTHRRPSVPVKLPVQETGDMPMPRRRHSAGPTHRQGSDATTVPESNRSSSYPQSRGLQRTTCTAGASSQHGQHGTAEGFTLQSSHGALDEVLFTGRTKGSDRRMSTVLESTVPRGGEATATATRSTCETGPTVASAHRSTASPEAAIPASDVQSAKQQQPSAGKSEVRHGEVAYKNNVHGSLIEATCHVPPQRAGSHQASPLPPSGDNVAAHRRLTFSLPVSPSLSTCVSSGPPPLVIANPLTPPPREAHTETLDSSALPLAPAFSHSQSGAPCFSMGGLHCSLRATGRPTGVWVEERDARLGLLPTAAEISAHSLCSHLLFVPPGASPPASPPRSFFGPTSGEAAVVRTASPPPQLHPTHAHTIASTPPPFQAHMRMAETRSASLLTQQSPSNACDWARTPEVESSLPVPFTAQQNQQQQQAWFVRRGSAHAATPPPQCTRPPINPLVCATSTAPANPLSAPPAHLQVDTHAHPSRPPIGVNALHSAQDLITQEMTSSVHGPPILSGRRCALESEPHVDRRGSEVFLTGHHGGPKRASSFDTAGQLLQAQQLPSPFFSAVVEDPHGPGSPHSSEVRRPTMPQRFVCWNNVSSVRPDRTDEEIPRCPCPLDRALLEQLPLPPAATVECEAHTPPRVLEWVQEQQTMAATPFMVDQ